MIARLLVLSLFFCASALAQSPLQTGITTSQAALPTLVDVQLSGTAKWEVGSDKWSGTVILKARRDGKSRMELQLGSRQRVEVRMNDQREPRIVIGDGSAWKDSAAHNSWNDANWFFPAFSAAALSAERGFALTDTSQNSVRTQFNITGQKPRIAKLIQVLSITDFQLDPTTGLISSMRWVTHPDDDFNVSIPCEVHFSDYRDAGGVKVPYRIQRYINGTLQLDIEISSVAFNPGIPASDFTPSVN